MKTLSTNSLLPSTKPSLKYRTRKRTISTLLSLPFSLSTCLASSAVTP
ncbi:MAG: hypothetical protein Q8M07_21200 [Prosthecobacter sp.]|nr:hypothetical protein [Prosthecobacter sp.]